MNYSLVFAILNSLLLIICVILLVIVINKNNKKDYSTILSKGDEIEKNLSKEIHQVDSSIKDEMRAQRIENQNTQSQQRKEITSAIADMSDRISKLSTENLKFNSELSENLFAKMTEMRNSNDQKLSEIRRSNEEKLEQMRLTVDEKLNETLTKRLDSSFKTVSDQLENVYKSLGEMKILSGSVTENVTSLNKILTNVKARGTWAEVQLEGLLDQTIPGMYEKNFMPFENSRAVVEFAVRIPSGDDKTKSTYLPIDSKFPIEAYLRLCNEAENGNQAGVDAERKSLESSVLNQAKEITKYINEPFTTPFAIMYLATEGLYSEIISSKNSIVEKCQRDYGVMIAGPSTLTALLNSLSVGFKAMAINEKAKEVRVVLAAAKTQYDKFGVVLEKAKKKLGEASQTLDDAQSRNNIIIKKLKSVEVIDQNEAQEILGLED